MGNGYLTRSMQGEEGRYSLDLLIRSTGESTECEVVLSRRGDQYSLKVVLVDGSLLAEASSAVDFEDALSALRATLEKQNRLLLCNRYRIDAFVSSMSRQMSDGLSCYIVVPNRPVDTSQIVDALASAPSHMVSTRAEADEFSSQWKATFDD